MKYGSYLAGCPTEHCGTAFFYTSPDLQGTGLSLYGCTNDLQNLQLLLLP